VAARIEIAIKIKKSIYQIKIKKLEGEVATLRAKSFKGMDYNSTKKML
jgi:hypothetical protein